MSATATDTSPTIRERHLEIAAEHEDPRVRFGANILREQYGQPPLTDDEPCGCVVCRATDGDPHARAATVAAMMLGSNFANTEPQPHTGEPWRGIFSEDLDKLGPAPKCEPWRPAGERLFPLGEVA